MSLNVLEKWDVGTIFLWPVFPFSLNVNFIFCKPTFSDNLIFFILVELHNVDDIIACIFFMLTMLMLTLLKISSIILMMNKILKLWYIPTIILLSELVMAPMMIKMKGESHSVSSYLDSRSGMKQQTNGLLYLYLFTV